MVELCREGIYVNGECLPIPNFLNVTVERIETQDIMSSLVCMHRYEYMMNISTKYLSLKDIDMKSVSSEFVYEKMKGIYKMHIVLDYICITEEGIKDKLEANYNYRLTKNYEDDYKYLNSLYEEFKKLLDEYNFGISSQGFSQFGFGNIELYNKDGEYYV